MGWWKRGSKRTGPAPAERTRDAADGPVDLAGELQRLTSPGAAAGRALARTDR